MSRAFSSSRFATRLSLCAGTALLLGACLDHPLKPVVYDKTTEDETTVAIAINKDVDILFVIDNSGSMAEEQALLSKNFAAFIGVLEAEDVLANYRIGITTTDSGNPRCPAATYKPEGGNLVLSSCLDRIDQGEFTFNSVDFSKTCSDFCTKYDADLMVRPTATAVDKTEAPRKWIERIEKTSNIAGVADNTEAFQCYGPQGVAGCGFESHLESMYLALAGAQNKDSKNNYGFLREAAILSLVFITDEADCSYNPDTEIKKVFTTNKVFWNDPDVDTAPTSALCWRAGVDCTGGPGTYTECHAQDWDMTGQKTDDPKTAVLQPVSKYIDFVKKIEMDKQEIDGNQRVLVSLIAGVPIGYEKFDTEIPYEDLPADDDNQLNFGIGPGCILGDPKMPEAVAVPAVREREFAEAFLDDPEKERNLYSICQQSYAGALESIATKIRDQIVPACMPSCVRDKDRTTEVLDPNCRLIETDIDGNETDIVQCKEVNGEWTAGGGATVCFATLIDKNGKQTLSKIDNISDYCNDEGFNLEFILVRSAPAAAGTTISANCELSDNRALDCPNL